MTTTKANPAKNREKHIWDRLVQRYQQLLEIDTQLQALMPDVEVHKQACKPALSAADIIDHILSAYADRPALGMRAYEIKTDATTGLRRRHYFDHFQTCSYQQLRDHTRAVANAWRHEPSLAVRPDEFVCIIGFASIDFAVLDFACAYAQAISVPLQSASSGADLNQIISNISPAAVATSIDDLQTATDLVITQSQSGGHIRSLIVFDYEPADEQDQQAFNTAKTQLGAASCDTHLLSITELISTGQAHTWQALPPYADGPERLASILHSSGSTGTPKGAMLTEATIIDAWAGKEDPFPTVFLLFAPMNHLLGRMPLTNCLRKGSTAYFTLKADMSTLFADIRQVRPTSLVFFPRVLDQIHQHHQTEVSRKVQAGQSAADASVQVQAQMRHGFLGDRLVAAVVGSAPTSPAVKTFMEDCFHIKMIEGYGSTEAGSGSVILDGKVQRDLVTDYKLRDVPELGYYTSDHPYPRGEFCFKSKLMVRGYYKQPEATAGLLDEDGYSLTGDIVEERSPDHVVIIDRRKDVLKLSQGEYVALGRLGTVYEANSPCIKQIYLYGNPLKAYLLAVVVPETAAIDLRLGQAAEKTAIRQLIRTELQQAHQQAGLRSFELPRDFIVEPEPFSQHNGLLSSVRKRLRPALQARYGTQLEALYQQHEQQQQQELVALKNPESTLSVLAKLSKLLAAELNLEWNDDHNHFSFAELGGDSLSAVGISTAIADIFAVSLPADSILNPTSNPQQWAKVIEHAQKAAPSSNSFAAIHGRQPSHADAADLKLSSLLGSDLNNAKPVTTLQQADTVLLTGATGFLGRQLCIQWLQQMADRSAGQLICLIRAADDTEATTRLQELFTTADTDTQQRYQQLAQRHLTVIAGDVSKPYLGLSSAHFQQLATTVDRICHVGALVNHRLGYEHLFAPNVLGTAEIIRLALSHRQKPVDFMSTEAVLGFLDYQQSPGEDAPPLSHIPLSQDYAVGYAASKWAAEHLLRQAEQQFGLPINILRGGMMLAHQHISGQINPADMFTRLLYSVIITGIAPRSFYQTPTGEKQHAHYNGVPVNVVADAMISAALHHQNSCQSFNIVNPPESGDNSAGHNDRYSLDQFIDWVIEAGHPITRIDDYQQWFQRFSDKLHNLPEAQKQHSAINLLAAWQQPQHRITGLEVESGNFQALMRHTHTGKLPSLNQRFVEKCLADMKSLGLLS